jgi:hypothetical protein
MPYSLLNITICRYEVVKAPYRCYALELPFDLLIANESEDARREYMGLLAETERLLGMAAVHLLKGGSYLAKGGSLAFLTKP